MCVYSWKIFIFHLELLRKIIELVFRVGNYRLITVFSLPSIKNENLTLNSFIILYVRELHSFLYILSKTNKEKCLKLRRLTYFSEAIILCLTKNTSPY